MKKIFHSVLLITTVSFGLYACSNGAYDANPSSPVNSSVNPLNPLKLSDFDWSGHSPVSASINGSQWNADTAYFLLDSTGASDVIAYKGSSVLTIHLSDLYQVEPSHPIIDSMGYHWHKQYGAFLDSAFTGGLYCFSYLGNSGEIMISENDSAFLKGEFYFQAVTGSNSVINVTNGWISIAKPTP